MVTNKTGFLKGAKSTPFLKGKPLHFLQKPVTHAKKPLFKPRPLFTNKSTVNPPKIFKHPAHLHAFGDGKVKTIIYPTRIGDGKISPEELREISIAMKAPRGHVPKRSHYGERFYADTEDDNKKYTATIFNKKSPALRVVFPGVTKKTIDEYKLKKPDDDVLEIKEDENK